MKRLFHALDTLDGQELALNAFKMVLAYVRAVYSKRGGFFSLEHLIYLIALIQALFDLVVYITLIREHSWVEVTNSACHKLHACHCSKCRFTESTRTMQNVLRDCIDVQRLIQ